MTIAADSRGRAGLLPCTEVELSFDGRIVGIMGVKAGSKLVVARPRCPSAWLWRSHDEDGCHNAPDPRTWIRVLLTDANVLPDVMTEGARCFEWSAQTIGCAAGCYRFVINPVIQPEVLMR